MQSLTEFFNAAEEGLGHVLVEALPEDVIITFEIEGADGGTWSVKRFGPRVSVRAEPVAYADCKLTCTTDDFRALISGDLASRAGFLNGRLRVEGDVGLVLRLEKAVLRRLRQSA